MNKTNRYVSDAEAAALAATERIQNLADPDDRPQPIGRLLATRTALLEAIDGIPCASEWYEGDGAICEESKLCAPCSASVLAANIRKGTL